ncbi:hypothetical protein V490_00317 [Pseudogymnoascus sp. VKM F-3557]|nr:hypothetical protein V490_00317 [Pseudogymnoascus sp. VKM F-3557]
MASPNDGHLWNEIPVDHRLKQFLPSTKQKHSHGVGKHADIIETFGKTMVRDNGTTPTKHEAGFASWLAKPDVTGGLVIALQQPAKSQVFTTDVKWVRDECPTLAYLDKSLAFISGPGAEEDLNKWNPNNLDFDTPLFISSNVKSYLPITPTAATRQSGSWTWGDEMTSIKLPVRNVFLLEGDTHLLLTLRCQTKVKVTKNKKRTVETNHEVLVPMEYTISEILLLIRASAINGIYQEPYEDDLRHDPRSVSQLGWTNGTVLKFELW